MERILGAASVEETPPENAGTTPTRALPPEEEIFSQERILTVRYKVYIAILAIIAGIGALELFPAMQGKYNSAHSSYDQARLEVANLTAKKASNAQNKVYLEQIESHQATLERCLNDEDTSACTALPESRNVSYKGKTVKDFSVPVSYLQLNSLYTPKMPIDEKKVLRNLNEYLIRDGIVQGVNVKNGDIISIDIGDPEPVDGSSVFFSVPIAFSIEFDRVGDLISFVRNVEKKLITDPQDRILYKIQEVGYDIVASNESQTTDIAMIAYYYYDPRFPDMSGTPPLQKGGGDAGAGGSDAPTESTVAMSEECGDFPERLKACTPYSCNFTHPLTQETMRREIHGEINGKCRYTESMPNDGEMICDYTESQRKVAGEYYAAALKGNVSTTDTDNPLQQFTNDGVCKIS